MNVLNGESDDLEGLVVEVKPEPIELGVCCRICPLVLDQPEGASMLRPLLIVGGNPGAILNRLQPTFILF